MTSEHPEDDKPFHFTDKRKVTPEGEARAADEVAGTGAEHAADSGEPAQDSTGAPADLDADQLLAGLDFEPGGEAGEDAALLAAKAEAAEHLDSLQRERAAFTNYRNRALRDQEAARTRGMEEVLTGLLPVLDDIDRARTHAELTGPFAAIAEKLDATLAKLGVERYGVVGEEFDPQVHEALMHQVDPEVTTPTVNLVIETGYRIGERVVRAARVSVVGPE